MDETVCISRDDFAAIVREFIERVRDDDSQQVLSQAILLDLTLEAGNAAEVLGLSAAGLQAAGEGIRASWRAYQRGDRSLAVDLANGVLSAVTGRKNAPAESAPPASTTLSLVRAPDGNYWIRILDEQMFPAVARETAARTLGPLRRNQVCHQLMLLGLKERQADAFIERVDIERTAEIRGIHEKPTT